ncbi:hypothetical protein NWE55_16615 (plasmid) [Myroides albus]|uniref:Uncharacterized protein n=1 Tax=Myroides odoratimimus TaxID=76832 RepID=A0AAI8C957_9FLAO|nr:MULTISPECIES: hypothetical protein [Myroides]ALU28448.1 hypothetical protein AS202_19905 [Myroides odoratimimus]UVD81366.1 hypothetical protein NWE55_16975 [Myroides albus]UVD81384.1 hypothetical protein NWE55_16615 [Myroides albus]
MKKAYILGVFFLCLYLGFAIYKTNNREGILPKPPTPAEAAVKLQKVKAEKEAKWRRKSKLQDLKIEVEQNPTLKIVTSILGGLILFILLVKYFKDPKFKFSGLFFSTALSILILYIMYRILIHLTALSLVDYM